MKSLDTEQIARLIIRVMVTRFGVRPNGSVQTDALIKLVKDVVGVPVEDVAAGMGLAVERGWVVQQENGLIRITEAGFNEA